MDKLKKCSMCGRMLPLSMFSPAKTCVDGLCPQCKNCVAATHRQRYYTNIALDRMPWPYDDDKHEMDMQAIAEYKQEKLLKRGTLK